MINAPSVFYCDVMAFGDEVAEMVGAGINLVHVDIMDGHYVSNLALPTRVVSDIKRHYPDLQVDAHMMVDAPDRLLAELAEAGADWVSFHADSTRFVRRTLARIAELGLRSGVAINPSQPVDVVEPYIEDLDQVTLMTVEPGFLRQSFIPGSLQRLEALCSLRERTGSSFRIMIDGGVDAENGADCIRRGADVLVTGCYATFDQPDGISSAIARFQEAVSSRL